MTTTRRVEACELGAVRLLDSPFRTAMERNRAYLHQLEPDRFLHTFRLTAGLPSAAVPYGGWEAPSGELRGHCAGHYLSGCALTFAACGDEAIRDRACSVVAGLAACQRALGTGYLSAWPETFIDRVEDCERVWAPYYTLHKILAGLLDMHALAGDDLALDTAVRMAGWIKRRTDRLDEARMQKMLAATEEGGMNEALANLYARTGDAAHLALSFRFNARDYTGPLERREDRLKGLHANSLIPVVVGFARQYEVTGDERLRDMAAFFWDQVVGARAYATGGTSNNECWEREPGQMADQLGVAAHETCCTYNLLRLTRHLFAWTGEARYADYYERALYNGILATLDPATGMTMYYMPMAAGLFKTFGTPTESFWCCTGTGMESHAKYGDSIYFREGGALGVNLFIPSELTWAAKGVTLRQATRFPDEPATSLVVRTPRPCSFALRLRIPGWAGDGVRVAVNGEPQAVPAAPASYAVVDRTWQDGDRVDLAVPMGLRLERLPGDAHMAAVACGPIVLAGQLGTERMASDRVYGPYAPADYPVEVPDLAAAGRAPADWLTPVDGAPLTFRTAGVGLPEDVTLRPFHATFERYAVYWFVGTEADCRERREAQARQARLPARTGAPIDEVAIGDAASERTHALDGESLETGCYLGRAWRQAVRGGWFAYRLQVVPEAAVELVATYWGADAGGRLFDILVDGVKIASEDLDHKSPGQFVDVAYPVPPELTRGKRSVTVRFQAHQPRRTAGGLFGLQARRAGREPPA